MEALLYGQIIDTLKCLSFDQLFALKQTNKYFKNFIGRYEHLLVKKEIKCIHISILKEEEQKNYKIIDLNSGIFNFTLNNEIENKLIETSKDFSKMISIINIYFNNCPRFNPSIRAENVKKRQGDVLCVSYKLSNIYNPVRYSIMNSEDLLKKFL
uniref:F-box domain-containing protein n=1 Tax=Meloidogyne hapla TaxID=6305 RepID=A0A1I8BKP5_MELHA